MKAVSYIKIDGADVLFDSLDTETKAECAKKIMSNVARAVSEYLNENVQEVAAWNTTA